MYSTQINKPDEDDESSQLDHMPLLDSSEMMEKDIEDLELEDLPVLADLTGLRSRRSRFLQQLRLRTVLGYLRVLLPSFLDRRSSQAKKLHASAWLDGMRGIAAWFVVIHHSSLVWFSWDIHKAWNGSFSETAWLVKLPIIRILLSGPPQVMIFFIISGYSISHKPLKLARQGRFAEVGAALSSGVFRRHPRLFIPAAFVTLCCALMVQLDVSWFGAVGLPGVAIPTRVPPHALNLLGQLMHWRDVEIWATNPIGQGFAQGNEFNVYHNPYDPNLWTLPIEFSGSMVVFTFITAFTRIPSRVRMAFAVAVAIYLQYYFIFWGLIPFLSGMFLCDLHFEIEEIKVRRHASDPDSTAGSTSLPTWARVQHSATSRAVTRLTRSRVSRRLWGILAFFVSLWLISVPESFLGGRQGWSHTTLASLISEPYHDHVLVVLGAICTVLVVDQVSFLQVLFTNPFSQYMGRISYSLYLVHGPLLWSLGLKTAFFGLGFTGWQDDTRYTLGILIGACLWWPVAIWAADLTARFVDEVAVRFTRWVYDWLVKGCEQRQAVAS